MSSTVTLDDLSFCGGDDEDVTFFFRSFLRFALSTGHAHDDTWLLLHLEASLAGAALQYYVNLDDASTINFKTARSALINRFGLFFGQPTPAASPAAAPTRPRPRRGRRTTSGVPSPRPNIARRLTPSQGLPPPDQDAPIATSATLTSAQIVLPSTSRIGVDETDECWSRVYVVLGGPGAIQAATQTL